VGIVFFFYGVFPSRRHLSLFHAIQLIARKKYGRKYGKTGQAPGEVESCYEAGVCGFTLKRRIEHLDCRCVVIAPSLVPRKPGERVKTDRRDARKLLMMHKAGLLTEVHAPNEQQEAARELTRLRETAWHYRHRYVPSKVLKKRRKGRPQWAVQIADAAGRRLSKRHRHLVNNGKMPCKANIAVARELAGFIWFVVTQYHARINTKGAA